MLTDRAKKELQKALAPPNISFDKEDLLCYAYDATNSPALPDAVAFPATAQEVSSIVRLAFDEGFPVVPRGAGTGFTGGSVPVKGGVVVSFERMNKIIEIDADNLAATVEPGVVTWDLQQEVEAKGLFYPPDPTSLKFSTIGGNIAENAGGPRAVKYGVTRDYVLGLEAVLPDGEIASIGVRTAKGVVGYDLTRLLVGSEGTLGMVTKARLRLLPLPQACKTVFAVFPSLKDAASAVSRIIKARIIPSTLEIVDSTSMRCVEEYAGVGLPKTGSFLLIESDGSAEGVEKETAEIKKICAWSNASRVEEAMDKKAVKDLWKARRAISASLFRIRPNKINEDIVVPRSAIVDFVSGIEDVAAKRGLLIACFGHAGDGNIHVNIMYDKKDAKEAVAAQEAVRDVFELTLSLGGTISGEHGVGITKSGYLDMELSPAVIGLMKKIKAAFDPKGIMNPGKIFPAETGPAFKKTAAN